MKSQLALLQCPASPAIQPCGFIVHLNVPEGAGTGLFSLKIIPGTPGKDQLLSKLDGALTPHFPSLEFPWCLGQAGYPALQRLGRREFRGKIISIPSPIAPKTHFKAAEQWHAKPPSTFYKLRSCANWERITDHVPLQQLHAEGWASGLPWLKPPSVLPAVLRLGMLGTQRGERLQLQLLLSAMD